ncbi:MAG: hypothetical protein C0596_19010 [Marinilabiliales bacterium]|nr:MAG: hypothetical protein C0596_19010 [Marinilabiliales bacterium]
MQKQTSFFLLLILILIVGLNSCSIEKRSYQPGYYVDWHNVNRKSNDNPEDKSIELKETTSHDKKAKNNNIDKIKDFNQDETISELEPTYASNDNNVNYFQETAINNKFNYSNTQYQEDAYIVSKSKKETINTKASTSKDTKIHIAAIIAIIFTTAGYGIWLVPAFIPTTGALAICVTISLLSILLGFIFAYAVLADIKYYPEKYSGHTLAKVALVFCIFYAAAIILGIRLF